MLLSKILEESEGPKLTEYYEIHQRFDEPQRKVLVDVIVKYFNDKSIDMSVEMAANISNQIASRFKSEDSVRFISTMFFI